MDFSYGNAANEALTKFGNDVFKIGLDMKKQEDERNNALGLLEFHTWSTNNTQNLLQDLAKRPYTALQTDDGNKGEQAINDLQSSFNDRVQAIQEKNPMLAVRMQKVGDGLITQAKQKYNTIYETRKKEHYVGVFSDFEKQQFDKAGAALDAQERAEEVRVFESGLLDLVNTGIIGADHAAKERLGFRQKVDFSTAQRLIRDFGSGRGGTSDEIQARIFDTDIFPYLTENDRSKLMFDLSVQDNKNRAQKVDQKLTQINAQLYDQFGGDQSKAISLLSVPANQAALGLTLNESNHLINSLQAQRKEIETQKILVLNEAVKKDVDSIFTDILGGRYNSALNKVRASVALDPQDKYKLIQSITQQDSKTDPVAYVNLEEKALRGVLTPQDVVSSSGLSKSDKAGLLSKVYSKMGQSEKEAEREAKDFIKHQIITTGMLGNPIPAEYDRVHRANLALDYYSDKAKKEGKPWTYKQYMDYADQLVNTFRTTPQTKIDDMSKMMKMGTPAKITPTVTSGAPPVQSTRRLPGESIDAYEKRLGIK